MDQQTQTTDQSINYPTIHSKKILSRDNLLAVVRRFLWLILLGAFLWQTYSSVKKYISGHTSVTFQHHNPEHQEFPSLSFCPLGTLPVLVEPNDHVAKPADNFSEAIRLRRKADYITSYEPAGRNKQLASLNVSNLPEDWIKSFTLSPYDEGIIECYTYTSSKKIVPGYQSQFGITLTANFDKESLIVFLNKPGQSLLVPIELYSTNYIKLPTLTGNGFIMYQIKTISHEKISCLDTPCHDNTNFDIAECITSYFESSRGCFLPWRSGSNDNTSLKQECNSAEDWRAYQDLFQFLLHGSEKGIYQRTGCYFMCNFQTYDVKVTVQETAKPLPYNSTRGLHMWFYLGSDGIILEKEILVYDKDDLVGNIGGFLGLFLGASILSMYDCLKDKLSKLI